MSTNQFFGVDACKGGWTIAAVSEDGQFLPVAVEKSFEKVLAAAKANSAALVLIDIPIGLKSSGLEERKCDLQARKFLGNKRRSSVFRVPVRQAVYSDSREKASAVNYNYTGKRISVQTWGIVPKIREVDRMLSQNPEAQSRVRETHPEVCFCALNAGKALQHSKKERNGIGIDERLGILQSLNKQAERTYREALRRYPRGQLSRDDILDAMITSITALMCCMEEASTFPEASHVETDENGLRMEIVYRRL